MVWEVREDWSPFWHLLYDYLMPQFPQGIFLCSFVNICSWNFKIENLRLDSDFVLHRMGIKILQSCLRKKPPNNMFSVNNWYIFLSKNTDGISPAGWFNINVQMQKQFIKQIGNHQLHYCNRANTVSWFSINGTIYRMLNHLLSLAMLYLKENNDSNRMLCTHSRN